MKENWCRHFNGIQHEQCEAGVDYKTVREEVPGRMYRWPCTTPELRFMCPHFEEYTAEEIKAFDDAFRAAIDKLMAFEERRSEDCPHCGKHVERLVQVAPCVYAEPCGCRVWQGSVPEVWKE